MKHPILPRPITLACIGLLGLAPALHAAAPSPAKAQINTPSTVVESLSALASRGWISTGPILHPTATERYPVVAVKDPSVVHHDGRWHIFATTADTNGAWAMAHFHFADWSEAPQAKPFYLNDNPSFAGYNCAPQVFYFRPHNKWYLVAQSPQPRFTTTTDITDPMSWTKPRNFFEGTPKSVLQGWLDYWIICDDTHAYLFFPDNHGRFYRSRTRIEDFPNGFDEPVVALQEKDRRDLFEGSAVYRIKGSNQYLLIMECMGEDWVRYFRAFTADSLDGKWTPVPGADNDKTPFMGNANVRTADGTRLWANGISHGEFLRVGNDETMTIDLDNLQYLYQGIPHGANEPDYVLLPYRLALLKPAPAVGK